MALNLTKLSTHAGIEYLLDTVSNGDVTGGRRDGTFLDYYTASGTPRGRWIGNGLDGLDRASGAVVADIDADGLFKHFRAPNGKTLGAKPRPEGSVAGFDLTFTLPKSVSVLWAMADRDTQMAILRVHEQAIADTLTWLEREALQSRSGKGGIAQVPVRGAIAANYHHWDTRDGDPHLHTHTVLSNKVQRLSDGKWVTIDARALYRAAVAASEIHSNYLLDQLHTALGVQFVERDTTSRAVVMDIDGISEEAINLFSGRHAQIAPRKEEAFAAWEAEHGKKIPAKVRASIEQTLWRQTRQPKDKTSKNLNQRIVEWKQRAAQAGLDLPSMLETALNSTPDPDTNGLSATSENLVSAATALTLEGHGDEIANGIVGLMQNSKSTWTIANLRAEAERMTRGVRCASVEQRRALVDAIVDKAVEHSVELSQSHRYDLSGIATLDAQLTVRGKSLFDDDYSRVFTSAHILQREQFILDATTASGPLIEHDQARALLAAASDRQTREKGFGFAADQIDAALHVVSDGKALSAIVGPAGTGKTTTMAALKSAWEHVYGHDTILGLTTSAQAASVLSQEIDAHAHTVAKWLYETIGDGHQRRATDIAALNTVLADPKTNVLQRQSARRRLVKLLARHEQWQLREGQLIILDEASMTGTLDIATITQQVRDAGAKLLLVGDPAQLDAIDAGGTLGMLERKGLATHLTSVWRFTNDWEKDASLALRAGHPDIIKTYDDHDRFAHGSSEDMLEAAYQGALIDQALGKTTILIAATNAAVDDLNTRFMFDRRTSGLVDATDTVPLRDNHDAGLGELVVSRKVDRTLRDNTGDFIRNGTQLSVEEIKPDHIYARRSDNHALIKLPRTWVEENVELGYAITAHRSQGTTVDTGHVVIPEDSDMNREMLYVAMTRGRESNKAWVGQTVPHNATDDLSTLYEVDIWKDTLEKILATSGQERTALETRDQWDTEFNSLHRLHQERTYLRQLVLEDIGRAHHDTAATRIRTAYAPEYATAIIEHPSFPALAGRIIRDHVDADQLRTNCPQWRLRDAKNPAARVNYHLRIHAVERNIDDASLSGNETLSRLMEENQRLMTTRRATLGTTAHQESWFAHLSPAQQSNQRLVSGIASYREMFQWTGTSPLGPSPEDDAPEQIRVWGTLVKAMARTNKDAHTTTLSTSAARVNAAPSPHSIAL